MSLRSANTFGATQGFPILPVAVLVVIATLAGIVTALAGGTAGYRAVYYVAVFALIVVGGIVAVTRDDPLRFAFLALVLSFPIANTLVPPGRLGLTVFDAVMISLTLALIGRKLLGRAAPGESLFPTTSWLIAWLLVIPCVVFSQFPGWSSLISVVNFSLYVFLVYTLAELKREEGFERLVLLLSVVVLLLAAGLFVDRTLHLNLSLRGSNVNQLSYISGIEIYRAGGFFQDPQKGGAFIASMITFLLLLSVRGRFHGKGMRFLVWAAIAAGSAALLTTISRSAILACVSVSVLALFAFNRWNIAAKLAIVGSGTVLAMVAALMPVDEWLDLLPAAVSERFVNMGTDFEIRRMIWLDTWNMFADHPLTGIGPGSFQPYLMKTRPAMSNYYDIGVASGVVYVPDQPESGYLKIFYEGGIIGSIALLLIVGDALRRAIASIAGNPADSDARTEVIAALAALLTFALTFVTLFTVSDPRVAAAFLFFLAVIWHRSLQRAPGGQDGRRPG